MENGVAVASGVRKGSGSGLRQSALKERVSENLEMTSRSVAGDEIFLKCYLI
jgi:hypothetical protein